ncbi:MAG: GNAT family N-acetyltransferase [Chloroflexi bacterium]|nr:GNAT family N-acetyltransferase [Chloroflexota bacterium]
MITYAQRAPVSDADLQSLGKQPWPRLPQVLARSFTWITAHDGERLVGFVNVAWDGGVHFFLLDTIVRADCRHRGIGSQLVREAIKACRGQGDWLHVDSDQALMREFYNPCGFEPTPAGLVSLRD